jgi:hypothetical protein
MVSLIERDHASVSFCSKHDLGTALPPPSVGGLRLNSPVTCGFASSRPALSRRPCAVGAEPPGSVGRARARAKARGRDLPPSEDVQFVPVLTSSARRAGVLRQAFGRDRIPPSHPRSRRLTLAPPLLGLGLRPASLPVRLVSFISELASHEVPGFGAPVLPSVLGLEALAPALAIARDHGVSASGHRWRTCLRRHDIPAGESSAETWPSLPVQRHPRGSNRVGEEGRANEELSGIAGQEACATSGGAFRIGPG